MGNTTALSFIGDGSALTGLTKAQVGLGNVQNVDTTNAANITSGIVSPARLGTGTADSTTYLRGDGTWQTVPINHTQNTDTGTTATSFQIDTGNSGPRIKNITGVLTVRNAADSANANLTAAVITATSFTGDGSALTGLTKGQVGLGNVANVDTTNAANISSGILPAARFDDSTHGSRSGGSLHAVATTSVAGFMSAADKTSLGTVTSASHTQNTDTGTTATSFQIDTGNTGPRIKNITGVMTVRNAADSANAALTASAFTGDGSALTGLTKGQVGLGNVANVDTTNAANISSGILPGARFDDTTHGNRSGGTLHAVATTSVAGFMSATDKTSLGTVAAASHSQNTDTGTNSVTFQIDTGNTGPKIKNIAGVITIRNAADTANAALTASAFTGDGSALTGLTKGQVGLGNVANVDTTNAANISSGILPAGRFDDSTHGSRSGGTLHALATTSVAGFMSATDKSSLDTLVTGSTVTNSYSATFNSTTDWGTASGGNYSITVNHNLNTFALSVNVWDETSGHLMTIPGVVSMPSANQVLISVPQSPDERFAGRIVILSSGGNAGSSPPVSNNAQTVVPKTFGMAIDGSGGIVATGTRGPRRPLAMTLTNWYIDTDVATTLSIDVYVNGSLISGTNPMTITAGTTNNSSTLTGWTTTIMQGDAVTFNVTSNTAAKNIIITMFGI